MKAKQLTIMYAIVICMVALDQALKLYIYNNFILGESREILPFFQLCYIENDGFAFGYEFRHKIVLTLLRIILFVSMCHLSHILIFKQHVKTSFLCMIALITAGALGNIIDCIFYGKWFGYETWLHGRVIDMLHFPLIKDAAGECIFFRPIFNLADCCITIAAISIIIWFRNDMEESLDKTKFGQFLNKVDAAITKGIIKIYKKIKSKYSKKKK